MRSLQHHLLAAAMLLAAVPIAGAGDIKIIANPSIAASSVSAEDLKGVFLLTKASLSNGNHVEPVLKKDGPTHAAFLKEYLAKSASALETYYRSLVFTGKASMPKVVGTDAEVAAYVAKTKGAIGYVSAGASAAGVKVLEVQ